MRRISWVLVGIFVLGFIVRLYRFDNPVADWHAFRQSDTNAVSTIFARDSINLLYPRYFDISNIQSGTDNPSGYRFVEFPIYNAVQAGLFGVFGILALEQWGRLISIFASLAGACFVYLLVKRYASELAGFFAGLFYLFLPFSIFFGRTILPDPSMAASILGGIYFFDRWLEKSIKYKVFGAIRFINSFYSTGAFAQALCSFLYTANGVFSVEGVRGRFYKKMATLGVRNFIFSAFYSLAVVDRTFPGRNSSVKLAFQW